MRFWLLPAALFLAAPAAAQMQPPPPTEAELRAGGIESPQPFKGANVILIHTNDSASIAYRKLAGILLSNGYALDRSDKDLLALNTKGRPAPRYNMEHVLRAVAIPSSGGATIQLRDAFTLPGAAAAVSFMAGQTETEFRGGQNSTFMICWSEMQRVAALYPGAKLTYATQR